LETAFEFESSKKITLRVYEELGPLKVVEWRKKENILKEMRVKIKDILSENEVRGKKAQEIAVQIVDLSKVNPD